MVLNTDSIFLHSAHHTNTDLALFMIINVSQINS